MHAAILRLSLMLLILCFIFLMPSLLLYFLGYVPINNFNRDDHETTCFIADMKFLQKKCSRSCNCYTSCHPIGKSTSCSTHCSVCQYDCYYVWEVLHVKKIDGTLFAYGMVYGGDNAFYDSRNNAQQKFSESQKYINSTFGCFYDDKVDPVKVLWTEENDQGYFIATAVVGGIGALCYTIHICVEIYWLWLYRDEKKEQDIEMK